MLPGFFLRVCMCMYVYVQNGILLAKTHHVNISVYINIFFNVKKDYGMVFPYMAVSFCF